MRDLGSPVRRPLTATGTNLLGLVKHVATVEARYFGEVFDRPSPEPLPRWQDYDSSDLWATEEETRDQIIGFYRRTWEHSDATINELPLDAPATCRGGRSLIPTRTCSPLLLVRKVVGPPRVTSGPCSRQWCTR